MSKECVNPLEKGQFKEPYTQKLKATRVAHIGNFGWGGTKNDCTRSGILTLSGKLKGWPYTSSLLCLRNWLPWSWSLTNHGGGLVTSAGWTTSYLKSLEKGQNAFLFLVLSYFLGLSSILVVQELNICCQVHKFMQMMFFKVNFYLAVLVLKRMTSTLNIIPPGRKRKHTD